jgi:hypothetical protein
VAMTDSGAGRLLGALVAPAETFEAIAARPTWVAPLVLLIVLATLTGYLVSGRVDYERMMRQQNDRSGGQMTAEQVENAAQRAKTVAPIAGLAGGLVVTPAVYLIVALLYWVGFKLLGSDLSYKSSLATALHSMLPSAVSALLAIPVIWRHGTLTSEEARSGSFLASNLGFLAPADAGPAVRSLLTSIDLFSLWTVALAIVGYRIVARVSRGAAIGVVLTLWLLFVVGKVALAALLPG